MLTAFLHLSNALNLIVVPEAGTIRFAAASSIAATFNVESIDALITFGQKILRGFDLAIEKSFHREANALEVNFTFM